MILSGITEAHADAGSDRKSNSTKAERNLIKEGNKAFEEGKFLEAIAIYDQALTENPQSDVAVYNSGVAYSKISNEDNKGTKNDPRLKAAELFEKASQSKDNSVATKAFYNLGNMAYNDSKFDQSIEYYKETLRREPENKKARQNLLLAQKMKQDQENKEDNKDQQQDQQDQQQKQYQQQQQQDQQQQQQPQPTQNSEQILQSVQNKENETRKKNQEPPKPGRRQTDKPW